MGDVLDVTPTILESYMFASTVNISCIDVNAPPEQEHGTASDWPTDHELTQAERARCCEIATPRTGHDRRRVWPRDEVQAVLDQQP
jgi:hypothetical protein